MKTNVQFGTSTYHSESLLDYIHINVWGPTKTASFGATGTLSCLLMIYPGDVGYNQ